jgi:glycosyltransferase involved in cell wall biosynthesis
MKRRLVIVTEIIAPYRIPVFNALANEDGIDLHVIFMAESDPTLRDWFVYKDEIRFSYEVLPSWRQRFGSYKLLLNRRVAWSLQKAQPDVIVCGGYNHFAFWQTAAWAKWNRVPFLLWVESNLRDKRNGHLLVEFLKRKFVGGCDGFIVAGTSSFEYVKSFGLPEQSIFTAPNAVDIGFFGSRSNHARNNPGVEPAVLLPKRFALFVGRLVREKGGFDLLSSYAQLHPELRSKLGLVFAGDGVARRELEAEAAKIMPGEICFPGFLHRDQLASCYARADMLVLPTHSDTWGLVVNEAMACSLPVVCTDAAGCVPDLVKDGWNGVTVPTGDVGALKDALERLAEDPGLRREMGRRSKEGILRNSPEACASGIAHAVRQTNASYDFQCIA